MGLLDIFDVTANLLSLGSKETEPSKITPPRVLIIFYILLTLSIVLLAVESKSIANLQSPVLFLALFGTIGIALSFIIMYFLWQTGLIEFFTKRFAVIILIPVLFLTIASASIVNTSKSEHGRLGFDLKLAKKQ